MKIKFNEILFLYLINDPFIGKTIKTNVEENQICVHFTIGDKEFTYVQNHIEYQLYGMGDFLGRFDASGLIEQIKYWIQNLWTH